MIDITKAVADAEEGLRIAESTPAGPWVRAMYEDGEPGEGPFGVYPGSRGEMIESLDVITKPNENNPDGVVIVEGAVSAGAATFIADSRTRAPEAYRNVIEMAGVIDDLNRRLGEAGELYAMALFDNERLTKERNELRAEVDRLRPLDEAVRRQRERDEAIEQGSR